MTVSRHGTPSRLPQNAPGIASPNAGSHRPRRRVNRAHLGGVRPARFTSRASCFGQTKPPPVSQTHRRTSSDCGSVRTVHPSRVPLPFVSGKLLLILQTQLKCLLRGEAFFAPTSQVSHSLSDQLLHQ